MIRRCHKVIFYSRKEIEEHLTVNEVNWKQVSNVTGYKRSVGKDAQRFTNLRIVEQFQKPVPQHLKLQDFEKSHYPPSL